MTLPAIPGLHQNAWANMTNAGRWSSLRQFENELAAQENREAAEVLPMPDGKRNLDPNGEPLTRGGYDPATNKIYVDPALVAHDEPFAATETTLHEARHAYQHHAIDHPGYHDDPQEAQDWALNAQDGVYYGGDPDEPDHDLDYALYRWQPMEADASQSARERTDELYEGEFGDEPGYAEYKAQREAEMLDARESAEATFQTPNVEEAGREATLIRAEDLQAQREQQLAADGETTENQAGYGNSPGEAEPQTEPLTESETQAEMPAEEATETETQAEAPAEKATEAEAPTEEATEAEAPTEEATEAETQAEAPTEEASEAETQAEAAGESSGASEDYDYSYGY